MVMTPRERILAVLKGEKPDLVPWFGDLDYWANSLIKRGIKPVGFIQSDDYIKSRAQFISLSNEEDGVAYAIQNVMQIQ